MDSWNATHGSPELKFENSPAESFLSTPSDMYPSLFGDSVDATMDPTEMMSPSSSHEDLDKAELDLLSGIAADSASTDPTSAETPAETSSEKKQTKKRKSWGQVLPEPKTNLPPRKRAKTEDEKEQRRVERVLRNRRAAQSSRERKRLEVEALEERNKQLEQKLAQSQDIIMSLFEKIEKMRTDSGVVSRQTPVTLSQELFSSHDALSAVMPNGTLQERKQLLVDELLRSTQSQTTVNPASISPALSPVADEAPSPAPEQLDAARTATTSSASNSADNMAADVSPDLTQHPAEVLCSDLQCRSAEASRPSRQPVVVSSSRTPWMSSPALALSWQLTLLLTSTAAIFSAFQRPLMLIAMSLKAGFSLPPTALILNTIIWLVTRPSLSRRRRQASTSSTSTSTSTATSRLTPTSRSSTSALPASRRATATSSASASSSTPSTTLRLRLLRKILTCSPSLARPLSDATLSALRLVQSEERRGVDWVNRGAESPDAVKSEMGHTPSGTAGSTGAAGAWLKGVALPSKEVLLTLVWAIKVEERMINIRARKRVGSPSAPSVAVPGRLPTSVAKIDASLAASSDARTVNHKILLTIQHSKKAKRARGLDEASAASGKRRRMG
ncbi:hypothetical protein RB595_010676 [Gaeumannomyces hyphopodioides]